MEIITGQSNPITLDQLTPGQRVYADTWMLEAKYHYSEKDVDHETWATRRRQKKQTGKATGDMSGKGNRSVPTNVSDGPIPSNRAAGKRPAVSGKEKSTSGTVQVTVPADASAQTDYQSLSGEFEKLLLREDKSAIKGQGIPHCYELAVSTAFSNYQYTLFMKRQLGKLEEELQSEKKDREAIKANLRLVREELQKGKTEWAETEAFLRSQLTSNADKISRLEAELVELKESKEQDIKDACYETAVEIRGTMSQQYLDGEAPNWPNEVNISRWKDLQELRRGDDMDDDGARDGE